MVGIEAFKKYSITNRKGFANAKVNLSRKFWSAEARILIFEIEINGTNSTDSKPSYLKKNLTWRFNKQDLLIQAWMNAIGMKTFEDIAVDEDELYKIDTLLTSDL